MRDNGDEIEKVRGDADLFIKLDWWNQRFFSFDLIWFKAYGVTFDGEYCIIYIMSRDFYILKCIKKKILFSLN